MSISTYLPTPLREESEEGDRSLSRRSAGSADSPKSEDVLSKTTIFGPKLDPKLELILEADSEAVLNSI